jgi:hypothetical protein
MNQINKYIKSVVTFLPIVTFLAVARFYGFTGDAWKMAFHVGAALALVICVFYLVKKLRTVDIAIAIYAFLWMGSIAFLFDIAYITYLNDKYQESVFWMAILVIKIINFLWPKLLDRFVSGTLHSIRYNAFMVLLAIGGTWMSSINHGDILYSAIIPFIIFKIVNDRLLKLEQKDGP